MEVFCDHCKPKAIDTDQGPYGTIVVVHQPHCPLGTEIYPLKSAKDD